ncbi:hypothetical protein [Nonomuraea antri]|uniref:hypothetical protein n=1 Tax=Nonomuraea antri TaxID=2730852 RepID=UPI001F157645|nr:hypothetical protein [Nonomuraea antri]
MIVLIWATMCLGPIPLSVPWIQLSAGAIGTPGTLTADWCEPLGRNRYNCGGTFVPDGGGPSRPVSAPADLEVGDTVRAQLAPEGDRAAMAGPRGVLGALVLPFLCVGGIGFLPYVILYWIPAATRLHLRRAVVAGASLTGFSLLGLATGLVAIYSA